MTNTMGRLALRSEGDLWVAYYAMSNTMDGAIFLGSIQLAFVRDEMRKTVFKALMMEAVADILEQLTGERPSWPEPEGVAAPEHERGGNA